MSSNNNVPVRVFQTGLVQIRRLTIEDGVRAQAITLFRPARAALREE